MYQFARLLSLGIRICICYITIETTPIFADEAIEWIAGQIVSIYSILWFISYNTVGIVFDYKRGDWPVLGVILYAIIYIPLALLTWGILWGLTIFKVLPI